MDTFEQFQQPTDPKQLDKVNVLDHNDDFQFISKEDAKISQLRLKKKFLIFKIEQLNEIIGILDKPNKATSKTPKKSKSTTPN